MYRVVIVDDEPWSIKSVANFLRGYAPHFQIVLETTDPAEALTYILKEKPDVVFTDIRMPGISGLELLRRARLAGCASEFIMVSGFADFSYAKESIRSGVSDYLLKPLDREEFGAAMVNLRRQLERSRKVSDYHLIERILSRQIPERELLEMLRLPQDAPSLQAIALKYERQPSCTLLEGLLGAIPHRRLLAGSGREVCLCCTGRDLYPQLSQQFGEEPVYAGISPLFSPQEGIARGLKRALAAADGSFIDKERKIFRYSPQNLPAMRQVCARLRQALEEKNRRALEELFLSMPQVFRENHLTCTQAAVLYHEVLLCILERREGAQEEVEPEDREAILSAYDSLEELCEYLLELCLSSIRAREENPAAASGIFSDLLDYVRGHYDERLKLKDLAARFYINPSYCSEMFRKHTGTSFPDYVTTLRLEKACELLRTGKYSVANVCDIVGYGDYFYFNRVFKKRFGVTPSQYKAR
ncbi:MAG: response regulator [Provencibacterium sp.]|jgi:two-component system response regulator YesN|nr:response regulator [Provencibacterium sp.]